MLLRPAFVLTMLCCALASAHAQDAVMLGKAEAAAHCARCHPALQSGRASRAEAKNFRSIIRSTDNAAAEAALTALLAQGHAGLGSETFSHAELGTLAAYLRTLTW